MLNARELLVVPNGDTWVAIGGNQRLRALRALGYEQAVCKIIPENYDRLAIAIKDNTEAGEWDNEMLAQDWDKEKLADWGVVPTMGTDANPEDFGEDFSLRSGEKSPFQQITFTLANEQALAIKDAIAHIKETDSFKYAETFGNENSNGNAIYSIVQQWEDARK